MADDDEDEYEACLAVVDGPVAVVAVDNGVLRPSSPIADADALLPKWPVVGEQLDKEEVDTFLVPSTAIELDVPLPVRRGSGALLLCRPSCSALSSCLKFMRNVFTVWLNECTLFCENARNCSGREDEQTDKQANKQKKGQIK